MALVRSKLLKVLAVGVLAVGMLAVQALASLPVTHVQSASAQHDQPVGCPDHADEPDNSCPCCPEGMPADGCFGGCPPTSAIVADWLIAAVETSIAVVPRLASALSGRTDVPPNPPPTA